MRSNGVVAGHLNYVRIESENIIETIKTNVRIIKNKNPAEMNNKKSEKE